MTDLNPTAPIERDVIEPTGDAFEDVPTRTDRLQFRLSGFGRSGSPGGRVTGVLDATAAVDVTVPDGADSAIAGASNTDIPLASVVDGHADGGGAAAIRVAEDVVAVAGGAGGAASADEDEGEVNTGDGGAPGGVGGDYFPDEAPTDDDLIDTVVDGGDADTGDGLPAVGGDGADVDGDEDQLLDTADGLIAVYAGDPGDAAVVDESVVLEAVTEAGVSASSTITATVQQEPFVALDLDAPRALSAPAGTDVSVGAEIAVRNTGLFEREFDIDVSVADETETVTRSIAPDETHTETVTVDVEVPADPVAAPVELAVDGESVTSTTHLVADAVAADRWVLSHPDASVALDAGDIVWTGRDMQLTAIPDSDTRAALRELAGVGPTAEDEGALGQFVVESIRGEDVFVQPPTTHRPPFVPRDGTIQDLSLQQFAADASELEVVIGWTGPRTVTVATVGDGAVKLALGDSTLQLAPRQVGQRTETVQQRVRVDEVPLRVTAAEAALLCDHGSHVGGAVLRERPFADAVAVDGTLAGVLAGSLSGTGFDGDLVLVDVTIEQVAPLEASEPYRATLRLARDVP